MFLLLAPTLLLWRVVFAGDVFLPADLLRDIAPWRDAAHPVPWNPLMWDGMAEFYPWRVFYARTLHQGYLPLWNPHQFCGTPFLANGQSGVLYPPNLLFAIMPVARAFGASVWLHLALTGLLMFGFLRSPAIGAGRAAATMGGLVWQLSAWQTVWLALPTFLCVSAWLPLSLWLTFRLAAGPSARRGAALGLTLGLFVLAGHLQIALYCITLTAAYALFLALPVLRRDRTMRTPLLTAFALAILFAAGTALPQILPTLELSRVSHRAGAVANAQTYASYIKLAVPPVHLLTLYLPGLFGSPTEGTYWGVGTNGGPGAYAEYACYVGILTLFLAIAGVVVRGRQDRRVRFFAVAALIAMLLALGTPLNALPFWTLPGFAQSGSPGRVLVLWTFGTAVLAAIGMDSLLVLTRRQVISISGSFLGLLMGSIIYAALWSQHNAPAGAWEANLGRETDLWRVPVGIGLGTVVFYALHRRGILTRRGFQGSLLLLTMADLLAANGSYNRTCRPLNVYPVTPGVAFLQAHAAHERVMPLNYAWRLDTPPPAILPPNSATVYGLYDTQGYDSLLTGRYIAWAAALNAGPPAPPENGNMVFTNGYESAQAQEAAVRYLVSRGPLPPSPGISLAFGSKSIWIYENSTALPRAYIKQGRVVVTEDKIPSRLRLSAAGAGNLTVADQWYPGWQTRVGNGPWRATKRDSTLFRTVPLQNTVSIPVTVTMCYWPATFRIGLYELLLTLAAATGLTGHYAASRLSGRRRGD